MSYITENTLGIRFGALAEPFTKQIKEQGFKYDPVKVRQFEKLNEYITHLMFADLLPEASIEKARKKLFTKIKTHIKLHNK